MSGKLLLKLDAIAFLLTHHTSGAAAAGVERGLRGERRSVAAQPSVCTGMSLA